MVRHRVCTGGGRCQWFYRAPDARLGRGIGGYRGFRAAPGVPQERLVVPSGRVSLLIGFGGELRVPDAEGRHTSLVSGLHTRARVLGHGGDVRGVELAMAPWAARRFFGATGLAELTDTLADPAEVLGGRVRSLAEALAEAPGWPERFALLDETLLRWSAEAERRGAAAEPAPAVLEAWRLLERSAGALRVHEVAAATGWSERHLESRFREQIGLGPKRLARVLRLNRAIGLLTAGERAADTAARCGYYDQAHLSREFTAMTGLPPGRFLADRGTASAWIAG
ncbi:helix-turn-helix transcriptional regulator [Streptomyces sp. NPDC048659]|uniref:helix-turn-helix domain-containing protein n=1 Tax=Streptomyces sp. NPDC048659 TaxID=3155489 RepID=UPI0034422E6F